MLEGGQKWGLKAERTSRNPRRQSWKSRQPRRNKINRESKRGGASLKKLTPLPLVKGKGIQGMGSPYKLGRAICRLNMKSTN
jgi:hypothetical protein